MSEVLFIRGVEVIISILATTDYDQMFFTLVRHNWWLLYILLAIHFNPQPEVDGCFFCTGMQEGIVTKDGIHAEEFQNLA